MGRHPWIGHSISSMLETSPGGSPASSEPLMDVFPMSKVTFCTSILVPSRSLESKAPDAIESAARIFWLFALCYFGLSSRSALRGHSTCMYQFSTTRNWCLRTTIYFIAPLYFSTIQSFHSQSQVTSYSYFPPKFPSKRRNGY